MIDYENILDTYSLTDIIELNEYTEAGFLEFCVENEILDLPNPLPVDAETPDR